MDANEIGYLKGMTADLYGFKSVEEMDEMDELIMKHREQLEPMFPNYFKNLD